MAFRDSNRSPWEKPPQPNLDEFLKSLQDRLRGKLRWSNAWMLALLAVAVWLLSGVFVVDPQEQAAVKTFGALTRIVGPGPNYHLPYPIETAIKERVTEVKRIEIGFRTLNQSPPYQYRDISAESLMLTGDESIVDIQFIVQYRISDLSDYLFNIEDAPATVRAVAESAMREVVGKTQIDNALTTGKAALERETRDLLSTTLNKYNAGVNVVAVKLQDVQPPDQVSEAFKAVASAREEKEQLINEAEGYRNDILPRARGEAEQMLNRARSYYAERVNIARGEADRFNSLLREYRKAANVTRDRIRIETMEAVLPNIDKVIIGDSVEQSLMPILSLDGAKGPLRAKEPPQ